MCVCTYKTALEKWGRRKRDAPERDAAEAAKEREWAMTQAEDNAKALRAMRRFIPADLGKLTAKEFEEAITARGGRQRSHKLILFSSPP